jgi:hypothetical protein
MTVYMSVGALFLTKADHTDSCIDSMVQFMLDVINTKYIILQEQSLSNINSEVLFFNVLRSFILQQRQTCVCLCHVSIHDNIRNSDLVIR